MSSVDDDMSHRLTVAYVIDDNRLHRPLTDDARGGGRSSNHGCGLASIRSALPGARQPPSAHGDREVHLSSEVGGQSSCKIGIDVGFGRLQHKLDPRLPLEGHDSEIPDAGDRAREASPLAW